MPQKSKIKSRYGVKKSTAPQTSQSTYSWDRCHTTHWHHNFKDVKNLCEPLKSQCVAIFSVALFNCLYAASSHQNISLCI